jgi:hypothetical protein
VTRLRSTRDGDVHRLAFPVLISRDRLDREGSPFHRAHDLKIEASTRESIGNAAVSIRVRTPGPDIRCDIVQARVERSPLLWYISRFSTLW